MKKNINKLLLIMLAVITLSFTIANNWKVTEDKYSVKISGTNIEGTFTSLKADIIFDPAKPENASIVASIDVNSLSTGFFLKTKHALSEEALDGKKYPRISFKSETITKKNTIYEFSGKLTLKGVTKNVIIPLTFTGNNEKGEFKGTFKVNPKEYNLTRHGVPDEITITLYVPVTR